MKKAIPIALWITCLAYGVYQHDWIYAAIALACLAIYPWRDRR